MNAIETVRAGKFEIPILYLDNHLLGVVKPCNMPVQADSSGDLDLLTISERNLTSRARSIWGWYTGWTGRSAGR